MGIRSFIGCPYNRNTNNEVDIMLKRIIARMVRRMGLVNLLIMIGDHAVKASKSKKDDEIWEEVKTLLDTLA